MLLTEIDETAASNTSSGETTRVQLRISTLLLLLRNAMGKFAAEFALQYSEVRLEITMEDRPVDMIESKI